MEFQSTEKRQSLLICSLPMTVSLFVLPMRRIVLNWLLFLSSMKRHRARKSTSANPLCL